MKKRDTKTKYDIIRVASEYFVERGYSVTSPNMIAKELNISTGNVTYYFPSKEHVLLVVTEMIEDYYRRIFVDENNEGKDSLKAACLEFMTIAAACEENPVAKDLFTSISESEVCREYVRKSRIERKRRILKKYCADWSEEKYTLTELMVMGIHYSMLMTEDRIVPLETRMPAALHLILGMYDIEEETRKNVIDSVLQIDYRSLAKKVSDGFIEYVKVTNEKTLDRFINKAK